MFSSLKINNNIFSHRLKNILTIYILKLNKMKRVKKIIYKIAYKKYLHLKNILNEHI